MTIRLLLAVLLALFAVPSMAASCHDAPVEPKVAVTMHHGAHQAPADAPADPTAAPEHQMCLGCIPPSTWRGAVIAAAVAVPPLPRAILIQSFVAGLSAPPALPPPRKG